MHYTVNRASKLVAFLALVLFTAVPAFAQESALERAREAARKSDFVVAAGFYADAVKEDPRDKEILFEAGDVNMELERYDLARRYYQQALELDNKDAVANRKYGLAASALGDHAVALESIRKAIKIDDGSMESMLALGQGYLAFGRDSLNPAQLAIIAAKKKYPDSYAPLLALGDLYYTQGAFELALTNYELALKIDSFLVEPRVRLGRSYREMAKRAIESERNKYYTMALKEFNRVTSYAPKNARAWFEQGDIFYLAEMYQEAWQSFETYVKLRPEDPRGDVMVARAAFDGRFFNEAVTPLERVLSHNDSLSRIYHNEARKMLAKSYYALKDYPKAAQAYSLIPDTAFTAESYDYYGSSLLLGGGDTTKALQSFRRYLELKPDDCNRMTYLGNLYWRRKQYDDVIDVFTKRITNCPTEPAANSHLFIGMSHYVMKRYDLAIAALDKALQADSTTSQAYYWLMNAYQANKQTDRTIAIARIMDSRDLVKTMPKEMAQAYLFLGKERFDAKSYKAALDWFQRSVQANPESGATVYLYMAFSHQLLEDKENACRNYRLALKYDPNNNDAKKNMKALGCE